MQDAYWAEQVDIQRRVAQAWQTFAQGQRDPGIKELMAAADAEDQTDKSAVSPGPLAQTCRTQVNRHCPISSQGEI